MQPVLRSPLAEGDIEAALEYLEERSPSAADRLAQLIDEKCRLLEQVPGLGRPRDDLGEGLRSLVIGNYVLIYRITADAIEVLRFLHGRRDIEGIMKAGNGG